MPGLKSKDRSIGPSVKLRKKRSVFRNRRMPKSIKDLAPIPGCLRMPVKMTLRRVLVPDASNSTVLRLCKFLTENSRKLLF